jgi:site-specific DNA-adenine methylase
MKNEKQTDSCETQTETCNTEEAATCSSETGNRFTTVKTAYARAAVFLLAVNFCLTGYVVYNMNQTTQAQIDGITGATADEVVSERQTASTSTPQTSEAETPSGATPPTPVTTRDQ